MYLNTCDLTHDQLGSKRTVSLVTATRMKSKGNNSKYTEHIFLTCSTSIVIYSITGNRKRKTVTLKNLCLMRFDE